MNRKSRLTAKRILDWADDHYDVTGRWPISRSGPVRAADDETTWEGVNTALVKGIRGLPGGDSLTRLLRRRRKIADVRMTWPDLSRRQILAWVDDHVVFQYWIDDPAASRRVPALSLLYLLCGRTR